MKNRLCTLFSIIMLCLCFNTYSYAVSEWKNKDISWSGDGYYVDVLNNTTNKHFDGVAHKDWQNNLTVKDKESFKYGDVISINVYTSIPNGNFVILKGDSDKDLKEIELSFLDSKMQPGYFYYTLKIDSKVTKVKSTYEDSNSKKILMSVNIYANDSTAPKVGLNSNKITLGSSVKITGKDNEEIVGWVANKNDSQKPTGKFTKFTNGSKTKKTATFTPKDKGTYYIWVQDASGNISNYKKLVVKAKIEESEYEIPTNISSKLNVLVIEINPILKSIQDEDLYKNNDGHPKAMEFFGFDSNKAINEMKEDIEFSSHGKVKINFSHEYLDEFPTYNQPIKDSGLYRLTEELFLQYANPENKVQGDYGDWYNMIMAMVGPATEEEKIVKSYSFDYDYLIDKFDLVNRRNKGEFDQVWLNTCDPAQTYETRIIGRNGYWCNSAPLTKECANFVMANISISRRDANLHAFGHGIESVLSQAFNNTWLDYSKKYDDLSVEDFKALNLFEQFTMSNSQSAGNHSGVGNVHFPFNGEHDYDYTNENSVMTNAEDWLNYPNLTYSFRENNSVGWQNFPGNLDLGSDENKDPDRLYMRYWLFLMPHVDGNTKDGFSNNWWNYIKTLNYTTKVESLIGYKEYSKNTKTIKDDLFKVVLDSGVEQLAVHNKNAYISSDSPQIVDVDKKGNLKISGKGRAKITCYSDGKSDWCIVDVLDDMIVVTTNPNYEKEIITISFGKGNTIYARNSTNNQNIYLNRVPVADPGEEVFVIISSTSGFVDDIEYSWNNDKMNSQEDNIIKIAVPKSDLNNNKLKVRVHYDDGKLYERSIVFDTSVLTESSNPTGSDTSSSTNPGDSNPTTNPQENIVANNSYIVSDPFIDQRINNTGNVGIELDNGFRVIFPVEEVEYSKDIRFSFDVYMKYQENSVDKTVFVPASTWISDLITQKSISVDLNTFEYAFILPVWVNEGVQKVDTKAIADNTAEKQILVDIVGKIYDLQINNSSDKDWSSKVQSQIFKSDSVLANEFPFGLTASGKNSANSASSYKSQNKNSAYMYAPKLGSMFTFNFKTKGRMNNNMSIDVADNGFYYVSKDGGTAQRVNLYYQVGGAYKKLGTGNDLSLKLALNNSNIGVNSQEVNDSRNVYKVEGYDSYNYSTEINIGTVKKLKLPHSMRLCYDNFAEYITNNGGEGLYKQTKSAIINDAKTSSEGGNERIIGSVGRWYAGYALPATTIAIDSSVSDSQAIDIINSGNKSDLLNDGYIIVVFDIRSLNNNSEYLRYKGPEERYTEGSRIGKEVENKNTPQIDWTNTHDMMNITLPSGKSANIPNGAVAIYEAGASTQSDISVGGMN